MRFSFFFLMSLLLINCSKSSVYKAEVAEIEILIKEVQNAEKEYLEVDFTEVRSRLDKIQTTIEYVKNNVGDEIGKEEALQLDRYRGTKSIVKRFGNRDGQIKAEFKRTLSQLLNFKEALKSGATHDKNEEKITEEYVKTNMKVEKEAAETLLNNAQELKERSSQFIQMNQEKLEILQPFLNSLNEG